MEAFKTSMEHPRGGSDKGTTSSTASSSIKPYTPESALLALGAVVNAFIKFPINLNPKKKSIGGHLNDQIRACSKVPVVEVI